MGLDQHIPARQLDPPISAKTLDHPILARGWTAHPSQGLDHRFYPSTVLLRPILARGWTTHFINKKGWTTPLYWLGWGDLTPPPSSPRGSRSLDSARDIWHGFWDRPCIQKKMICHGKRGYQVNNFVGHAGWSNLKLVSFIQRLLKLEQSCIPFM